MVLVNLTGPWYQEKGLEVWSRVNALMVCTKRMIGLIIAGVTVLIILVVAARTSAEPCHNQFKQHIM